MTGGRPSPSVLPPGYTVGGMAPYTFVSINDGQRDRLALFGEWEAEWNPRWLSQLGVRSEMVMIDTGVVHGYNDTMMYNGAPLYPATTFNDQDRERTDLNFDLTALTRHTPSSMQTYELGYARKTRSPNLYERYAWSINTMAMEMINFTGDGNYYVGNLDLDPEVAHTISVTGNWHDPAENQWGLKVTPYYTYVQDYINVCRCPTSVCGNKSSTQPDQTTQPNLTASQGFVYLQFVNEDARLYGVDVSGHVLIARTDIYGSFTASGLVNYVRGESDENNDNLYNIMPLNAKVAVTHRLGQLTSSVEGQFVSRKGQVSSVRNEVETAGYGLMNLRSGYAWRHVRLDAGVDNVFDRQYDLPLGRAYVGQGPTMSGGAIPWGCRSPAWGARSTPRSPLGSEPACPMEWIYFAIDYGIIGLLLLMSIVSCGIAIERYLVYRKIRITEYADHKSLELVLTGKLHIIATVGSNAPYIGLLGTVLGIMLIFYAMGRDGVMDTGKIMVGLALALKATAVGLVVAIPLITLYNLLLRRSKVLMPEQVEPVIPDPPPRPIPESRPPAPVPETAAKPKEKARKLPPPRKAVFAPIPEAPVVEAKQEVPVAPDHQPLSSSGSPAPGFPPPLRPSRRPSPRTRQQHSFKKGILPTSGS